MIPRASPPPARRDVSAPQAGWQPHQPGQHRSSSSFTCTVQRANVNVTVTGRITATGLPSFRAGLYRDVLRHSTTTESNAGPRERTALTCLTTPWPSIVASTVTLPSGCEIGSREYGDSWPFAISFGEVIPGPRWNGSDPVGVDTAAGLTDGGVCPLDRPLPQTMLSSCVYSPGNGSPLQSCAGSNASQALGPPQGRTRPRPATSSQECRLP